MHFQNKIAQGTVFLGNDLTEYVLQQRMQIPFRNNNSLSDVYSIPRTEKSAVMKCNVLIRQIRRILIQRRTLLEVNGMAQCAIQRPPRPAANISCLLLITAS
jgi:hypothetical protein